MEPFPTQIPEWVRFEHEVAEILQRQETHGWYFDERAAWELAQAFQTELEDTMQVLRRRFPFVAGPEHTPARNLGPKGYVKGATFTRLKDTNVTSRDHISWILQNYDNFKPKQLTATGKPIIDEVVLLDHGTPLALQFLKCLDITKKLGMISQGVNAWLKLVTNEQRIHHHCSVATSTHRCAHRRPNLAQVPSDPRFRELFTASPGMVMVGADLSGIELRMLAHYLGRYDNGRYAEILLNGDIHQVNADKIGISRKQVKTVTYAFLYGAGDEKIGHSFDAQLPTNSAKKKGKEIRKAYVEAIPGLSDLLEAVQIASKRGFIKSIDGRKIILDSPHKGLNYLLQSSAGVIAKRWMLINQETIKKLGIEAHQLAFVHDELQFETYPPHINDLSSSLVLSATEAGEYYNLRCRIDAEAVSGSNWGSTH